VPLALSLAERQALVPMAAGYLILMSALAFGLRRLYRSGQEGPKQRTGRQVAGTVIGGYLLLLAVVVAYYYGVARVGPGFLEGAVTGTALLLALATPVFAALSWLTGRRRRD
jgi:hypothetical protein